MKPRGMTFTGPSILALMTCAECGVVSPGRCPECGSAEKRKRLTRRVARRQPARHANGLWRWQYGDKRFEYISWRHGDMPKQALAGSAPHQPGDIVYAKEGLLAFTKDGGRKVADYAATRTPVPFQTGAPLCVEGWYGQAAWQWKRNVLPSRFMPRWAARTWRDVVAVRAERVQDISEEDAIAEGTGGRVGGVMIKSERYGQTLPNAIYQFAQSWDALHAKRHGGAHVWEKNPVVFVYTLAVINPRDKALCELNEYEAASGTSGRTVKADHRGAETQRSE